MSELIENHNERFFGLYACHDVTEIQVLEGEQRLLR
jgi:hypothetical protein